MLNWVLTQNFTDLTILGLWLKNLGLLFLILLTFYLYSFFLFQKGQYKNDSEKLFFRLVTGIALFCFISIPFFLLNIYSIYIVVVLFLLPWFCGFLFRYLTFIKEISGFLLILKQNGAVLFLFTFFSYVALLPPYRCDEMAYHLAYVVEFAQHNGAVTDPFMRLPLFTFNWHVVQTAMYKIGGYQLCHFLTWATSVLASIGIFAFLKRLEVRRFIAILASISFYFTPLVLRYSMVFHNDVPLLLFLLSSVYSLYILSDNQSSLSRFNAVLCCSMFIGMKIINIVYIPVFIFILLFWAKDSKKAVLLFSISLIVLGSVWYIRNILIDHDPIPPTINYALGKQDLFWSKEDYSAISGDLKIENTDGLMRYVKLPWMMMSSSTDTPLRDFPVFLYILLLPLVFIYAVLNVRKKEFVFWGLTSFAIVFWVCTSYIQRYAHFMALLVIGAAFMLNQIYGLVEKKNILVRGGALLLLLFIFFGPKYSSIRYSFGNINVHIPITDTAIASFATYGRPEIITSVNELKNCGVEDGVRIYTFGLVQYKYYFLRKGYNVIGDVVNKFRYKDFISALQAGRLNSFLNESEVKVLYVDKSALSDYPGGEAALTAFISGKTFKQLIDKGSFWIFVI